MTVKELAFHSALNALLEGSASAEQCAFVRKCCLEDRAFTRMYLREMDTYGMLDIYLPSVKTEARKVFNFKPTIWAAACAVAVVSLASTFYSNIGKETPVSARKPAEQTEKTTMNITKHSAPIALALATLSANAIEATGNVAEWNGAKSGYWTNTANWVSGTLPANGDTIKFPFGTTTYNIYLDGVDPVIGGISIPEGNAAHWAIRYSDKADKVPAISFTDGAEIAIGTSITYLQMYTPIAGDATVRLTGLGTIKLNIANPQFTGKWNVTKGRIIAVNDLALGAVPSEYVADSITLSEASLCNDGAALSIPATRGITLASDSFVFARKNTLTVNSPITGAGGLNVMFEGGTLLLNAENSYLGTTCVGADNPQAQKVNKLATLLLGCDNALPSTTVLTVTNEASYVSSIQLGGTAQSIAGLNCTLGCATAGNGTLTVTGNGEHTYVGSMTNGVSLAFANGGTFSSKFSKSDATVTMNGGTITLEEGSNVASPDKIVLNNATADLSNVSSFSGEIVVASAGTVNTQDSLALTGNLTGGGTLAVVGTGESAAQVALGGDDTFQELAVQLAAQNASLSYSGKVHIALAQTADIAKASSAQVYGVGIDVETQIDGTTVVYGEGSKPGDTETISLANSGTLCLKAVSLANDISLSQGTTVKAQGDGTVALSGKITGSGEIAIEKGTVLDISGADLSAFTGTISSDSGILFVPQGETLTVAQPLSGRIRKTGEGSLVIAGTQSNEDLAFVHQEGIARLANTSGYAVSVFSVNGTAKLVIDGDNQVGLGYICYLYDHGVLDLNGHDLPIKAINSLVNTTSIVNSSATDATLYTSARMVCYSKILQLSSGKIHFVHNASANNAYLVAPLAAGKNVQLASLSFSGPSDFIPFAQYNYVTFRFLKQRGATAVPEITEIVLTLDGVPIDRRCYNSVEGSGTSLENLIDNLPNTAWRGTSVSDDTVTISLHSFCSFNGYRICISKDKLNDPCDWDVEVRRASDYGSVRVDSRRNHNFVRTAEGNSNSTSDDDPRWLNRWNLSENFLFSDEDGTDGKALANTDVTINDRIFRVAGPRIEVKSLSGTGNVRLYNGSDFYPGDLSNWQGAIDSVHENSYAVPESASTVWLNGETGASVQAVRSQNSAKPLNVKNATSTPVSVLLDETYDNGNKTVWGTYSDGNGTLGLVKRGANTLMLADGHGDYTGTTAIEQGTLRVDAVSANGRAITARHVRFTPTKMYGADSICAWGANEFQLMKDGEAIAWPSTLSVEGLEYSAGPLANLTDGDLTSRYLSQKPGTDLSVTFHLGTAITFDAYRYYYLWTSNANANNSSAARIPTAWTLEISEDGVNWITVDTRSGQNVDTALIKNATNGNNIRGTYSASMGNDYDNKIVTLPMEHAAGLTAESTATRRIKARYLRFAPFSAWNYTDTRPGEWCSTGWQLTEFQLYTNGAPRRWSASTTIAEQSVDLVWGNNAVQKLVDNVLTGDNRFFSRAMPCYVTINAQEEVEFDAYGFVTGPNTPNRTPKSWQLYVSNDKENWTLVDTRADVSADLVEKNSTACGPWTIPLWPVVNETATDALSDNSCVAISSGATLLLNTAFEKIGGLSGQGTVQLLGATLAIDAITDASFSGAITGNGTLRIGGTAKQTLSDAVLSGVNTLSLQGGTLAGTATTSSALTVNFGSGVYDATVTTTGAFNATGTPQLQVPDGIGKIYKKRLFNYASIDEESAAVLRSAVISGVEEKTNAKVNVTSTYAELTVAPAGTVVMLI